MSVRSHTSRPQYAAKKRLTDAAARVYRGARECGGLGDRGAGAEARNVICESYNVRFQFIASRCRPTNVRDQIQPAVRRRSHMRKILITSVAAMALVAAGTFFGSMHRT